MQKKDQQIKFYSFFTKYSLMEDYGFSSGFLRRLFRKILPQIPDENTIEYFLLKSKDPKAEGLAFIDLETISKSGISDELDLSIKALGAKICTFGLDNNIKTKFNFLELDVSPFEALLSKFSAINTSDEASITELIGYLEKAKSLVELLRKNKNKIGTNFHLTVTTRKILEYIIQTIHLLELKINIDSKKHWEAVFIRFIEYSKTKNSIRRYAVRHGDLVALEIVEHTSNKGGKYIADDHAEYWSFFYKSLLGGALISIFALVKIGVESYEFGQLKNALFFSINYAICFIVVKQFGGIIATKQPAVTASTIAKRIDKQDDLEIDSIQTITTLIRSVSRSQFISIVGNFVMALLFSCVIAFLLKLLDYADLLTAINSEYLMKKTIPSGSLVFFAMIAGFFLALSGLISGYVDNKIVASKIPFRVRNSIFKSSRLEYFIENKMGSWIGNIALGFFLGSASLFSTLLPFSIDIRHIAFSSANIGYAIMNFNFDYQMIFYAMSGALLIGFINFIVSFSITLFLALKSRGGRFRLLPVILKNVAIDILRNPLAYIHLRKDIVV